MRRAVVPFLTILLLSLAVAASRGGDLSHPALPAVEPVAAVDHGPPGPDPLVQLARAESAVEYGQAVQRADLAVYLVAVEFAEYLASIPAPPPPTVRAAPAAAPTVGVPSSGGCGGDLPPCYVKARESGGDYSVANSGGSGACGAWQIMPGTWNGYGGYASACDAPPAVQDAKARELWAGGAGCGHWSAC